ncbi:MAG: hypothetical protein JO180_10075, partial [Gemmatirosa sp.]|nr:hypothetical protein [Gemmatirosa sp.]
MARYFYAGGERHSLEPVDDRVAVDTRAAAGAGLADAERDALRDVPVASTLPGGLAIVDRAALGTGLPDRLQAAGLARPVYRSGAALVVLLPEVRVELEGDQRAAALAAVGAAPVACDVVDDAPDRLTLRPRSGRGEDALD